MSEQEAPLVLPPPESQFSLNWRMNDGYGADVQVTMRATRLEEWADVMKQRKAFVEKAQEHGWTFNTRPSAPAAPASPPPPANGSAQTSAPNTAVQTLHSARVEIAPQSDGKVSVKFYAAGHKYPDLYTTRPAEAVLALLKLTGQWGKEHVSAAGSYDVPMRIEWRESDKLNSKGNPYKDILAVHPA